MHSRFLAWVTKVRNKSGGSSSEWVCQVGRRPDVTFSLGHFEVPIRHPVGEVQ